MSETTARKLVRERAKGRCEVCGGPGYEYSHRRRRNIRGHAWCPCNGVLSCRTCHAKMHAHPERARELGLHVSAFEESPSEVPVTLLVGEVRLFCDGTFEFLQGART